MARTGQPSREHVASSRRALEILELLAAEGALGTNEMARRLATTPSTVSRQLGTLAESRFVEQIPESGRYRLGIRVVELANALLARLDVRTVARPFLESLVAEIGETATLSVPGDPDAITVDFVAAQRYVQGVAHLGRPSIAHATAAGKVMLAFGDAEPVLPLARYTPHTITDGAALAAELDRVRLRGFAEAHEERELELNAVAAPVFASSGSIVGIVALQGPVSRFGRAAARAALPQLLAATEAISSELGRPGAATAPR
jgi:DNA-binding IclR family transcriptional regulator